MRQGGQQAFHRGGDRILGGVCSGLAAGFHVDPLWVRIAFVILAFFQGIGLFLYIVLWLVMPELVDGQARSGFDSMADDLRRIGRELRAQFGPPAAAHVAPAPDPSSPSSSTPPPAPPSGAGSRPSFGRQGLMLGLILVGMGGLLLATNTGLVPSSVLWPIAPDRARRGAARASVRALVLGA